MMSKRPAVVWRRYIIIGLLLIAVLLIIDRILLNSRVEEEKTRVVLSALQVQKVVSSELHTLFHGVQDDFHYFEKKISELIKLDPNSASYKAEVKSQLDFLETHSGYFKVRLTDSKGQELFKIVEKNDHSGFYQAQDLYDLSDQPFYQELNKVQGSDFYFSSMDANIINGVVERPIRPTVRVSKRIGLNNGEQGLLVFNIDGQRILKMFQSLTLENPGIKEIVLLDGQNYYVASYPELSDEQYTLTKTSLKTTDPALYEVIGHLKSIQGSFDLPGEVVVHSQLSFPNTSEKWLLVTRVPEVTWEKVVQRDRLTWIFWEIMSFFLVMAWLWRDEEKRHEDEVVKVLLKERSEFIQNVSHQLKTPLAIMFNTLESKTPTQLDWDDIKKEMRYLIKVVDDMLLLAQMDASHTISRKEEDILDVVSEAVDITGPKAKSRGVQIRFNVDEKLLASHYRLERPVMGELLTSAIVNVIDNAIDFSPQGEVVDVFVAFVEGKVVIQVKDNGPGIPDEFIPKLYERFARNDRTSGRKGTGLGLSITKKIIELHNGEIILLKHKNGTVFEIRL